MKQMWLFFTKVHELLKQSELQIIKFCGHLCVLVNGHCMHCTTKYTFTFQ